MIILFVSPLHERNKPRVQTLRPTDSAVIPSCLPLPIAQSQMIWRWGVQSWGFLQSGRVLTTLFSFQEHMACVCWDAISHGPLSTIILVCSLFVTLIRKWYQTMCCRLGWVQEIVFSSSCSCLCNSTAQDSPKTNQGYI